MLKRIGWNAVWLAAGLALLVAAGEIWLRVTTPFAHSHFPMRFVPGVGLLREPHTQVRYTNRRDFWTISRANRLGFLDREPPDAERAAESCHIAVIGDSFVDAREVPIAHKVQVQLENLAARDLPELDVTTSAYGLKVTGQINQLPFYDEYARRLRPKLVILVFAVNDYVDNFGELRALVNGFRPGRYPYLSAIRNRQGAIELHPPSADYAAHRLPMKAYRMRWLLPLGSLGFPRDLDLGDMLNRLLEEASDSSYFVSWLGVVRFRARVYRIDVLQTNPDIRSDWVDDWSWVQDVPPNRGVSHIFRQAELPPILERALDYTAFGLDQFRERAERDGFRLALLTAPLIGAESDPRLVRIHSLAEARGIPVIDLYDWIVRQGGRGLDGRFPHDFHWNAVGHRWAAEALLEYLERNQGVCRPEGGARPAAGLGSIPPPQPRTAHLTALHEPASHRPPP